MRSGEGRAPGRRLGEYTYVVIAPWRLYTWGFGLGGSEVAEALPVCEVVSSPPRESVAILSHIGHATPGCRHDRKSV